MERIFITGATSGIGRELALQYAAEGTRVVGLVGRRADRLEQVAAEAKQRGAREVHLFGADVGDRAAMVEAARAFLERAGGVDLVVANAGVGAPDRLSQGDPGPVSELLRINVQGVIHTIVPFVPAMKAAGRGHVVAVASVAGFRALGGHAGYCASKIAVRTLLDGWSYDLARWGIRVTCVNPGFVKSEMTAPNEFPMPFLLETDDAVRRIRRAIRRGKRELTFPLPMAIMARLMWLVPRFLIRRLPR